MLAQRALVSHGYINFLESGQVPRPGVGKLRLIAQALGVVLEQLLGELPLPEPTTVDVFTLLRGTDPDLHATLERIARETIEEWRRKHGRDKPSSGVEPGTSNSD